LNAVRSAAHSVVGRQGVRALDQATIKGGSNGGNNGGIDGIDLMERAGTALADLLDIEIVTHAAPRLRRAFSQHPRRLLVLAGCGNNGGDGFVVARLLAERGWDVSVALMMGEPPTTGEAGRNLAVWRESNGRVLAVGDDVGGDVLDDVGVDVGVDVSVDVVEEAQAHGLVLDCIFGTGLTREIRGTLAETITALSEAAVPTIACDIASGLCADTGRILGVALRAEATITIGAAKPGLFLGQGPDMCGRIHVVDIGLQPPSEVDGVLSYGRVLTHDSLAGALEPRATSFHKGRSGHVVVVAGGQGKRGAAFLAARGALRAGAGLVTMALPASAAVGAEAALVEAMTFAAKEDDQGNFSAHAAGQLLTLCETADAVVIGPGMGLGEGATKVVRELVARTTCPLVLDADALNILAGVRPGLASVLERRRAVGLPEVVLTPHPGEMARLLGKTSAAIQDDRLGCARELMRATGGVLVLKGAATLIADPDCTAWNTSGNPAMASPGMGDVLAGMIAALQAAGKSPTEAAAIAVWAHGRAADLLYDDIGAPGFLASEVADTVPSALAELVS
jgi:hydroxyethylthiazole kinase-like uncharacterized protein yjeF